MSKEILIAAIAGIAAGILLGYAEQSGRYDYSLEYLMEETLHKVEQCEQDLPRNQQCSVEIIVKKP